MVEIIRFSTENKEYENIELHWNRTDGTIELVRYTNKFKGFIEITHNFKLEVA